MNENDNIRPWTLCHCIYFLCATVLQEHAAWQCLNVQRDNRCRLAWRTDSRCCPNTIARSLSVTLLAIASLNSALRETVISARPMRRSVNMVEGFTHYQLTSLPCSDSPQYSESKRYAFINTFGVCSCRQYNKSVARNV
jgi:hypothetical protein